MIVVALKVLLMGVLALAAGCAVQPWVKPHERERLVDPMLKWSESPLADRQRERLRTRTEGARGGILVPGVGREDQ
jgi:hypothetical protein